MPDEHFTSIVHFVSSVKPFVSARCSTFYMIIIAGLDCVSVKTKIFEMFQRKVPILI